MTKKEFLLERVGEPVFVMGIRYSYRGTVVSVSEDGFVLKDAFVVLSTGSLTNKKPTNEEALPGVNFFAMDAFEAILPYLPFLFADGKK